MKYMVTLNGKNYEVEVEKGEAILVAVNDAVSAPAPVAASAPTVAASAAAPAAVAPTAPVSGKRVDSPLPGTIVDIKVSEGASVKKGEVLVIIEAMKMENEIVSPDNGIIGSIVCTKGGSIATGDLLLTLV